MPDRFVVVAVDGYTIRPGKRSPDSRGTSYSVIDTVAACREVGRFYFSQPGDRSYVLKRRAEELCAYLNAQEAAYEALHA